MFYIWNCRRRFAWLLLTQRHDKSFLRRMKAAKRSLKQQTSLKPRAVDAERDRQIVKMIVQKTAHANRNNITRTQAYLDVYLQHPELHWALLAHAVSRNAGYGMTDLQGEFFPMLADESQPSAFFSMLERANWLIFQDAYPQLLLYIESRRLGCGRQLNHLLAHFHVSRFMRAIWDDFLTSGDSRWLTYGLIVNEQHYIEARVVKQQSYQSTVLHSLQFQGQTLLNLTEVCLPYQQSSVTRLNGTVVDDFTSIDDRIQTGKRLYNILFAEGNTRTSMHDWLRRTPHTASRADYWPHLFRRSRPFKQSAHYQAAFSAEGKSLRKLHSPALSDVWPDVGHEQPDATDWFYALAQISYMWPGEDVLTPDVSENVYDQLKTMDQLVQAKLMAGHIL